MEVGGGGGGGGGYSPLNCFIHRSPREEKKMPRHARARKIIFISTITKS